LNCSTFFFKLDTDELVTKVLGKIEAFLIEAIFASFGFKETEIALLLDA